MSEINAIATNNYILHNIDAKKLYVQEPLFTANSGDAVYVGWRPDETVLWEGTAFTPAASNSPMLATAALSESIDNFDKIRLDFSGGFFFAESVLLTHPVTSNLCYVMVKKEQANNDTYIGTHYRFSDDTTLSGFCSYGSTQNVNAMTGGYWSYGGVYRVVGINRKENV